MRISKEFVEPPGCVAASQDHTKGAMRLDTLPGDGADDPGSNPVEFVE